jgi:hypothetical protein
MVAAGLFAAMPTATAQPTSPAAGPPGSAISVTGGAIGHLPGDRFPQWAGHQVRLSIDAHATDGDASQAVGTWSAVHSELDGRLHATFGGTIDALVAAGSLAVMHGVVTWADNPSNPTLQMVGTPVAISVADRSSGDRVGFTWGFAGEPVQTLQAHVPFFALEQSSLTVRGTAGGPRGGGAGDSPGLPERHVRGAVAGSTPAGRYELAVTADARAGAAPNAGNGTIRFVQRDRRGAVTSSFRAGATEFDAAGAMAIITATVIESSDPERVGRRVTFSVYDGGSADFVGWAVPVDGATVLPAQGVLPTMSIDQGNLVVCTRAGPTT